MVSTPHDFPRIVDGDTVEISGTICLDAKGGELGARHR
jgi:hypothetical protein